jgi:hypothetical protein
MTKLVAGYRLPAFDRERLDRTRRTWVKALEIALHWTGGVALGWALHTVLR